MAASTATSGWITKHANHGHEGAVQVFEGCTASATVTGGQILAVSGSGTLAPATANSAAVVGIAIADAASAAAVRVFCPSGVWTGTSSGSITAGDKLVAGAAGTLATIAANTFEKIVGTSLDTVTTGLPVRWVPV